MFFFEVTLSNLCYDRQTKYANFVAQMEYGSIPYIIHCPIKQPGTNRDTHARN